MTWEQRPPLPALGAGREPDSGTVRRGFRTSARFRRSVASDPTGIRCLPSGGARSSTDCRQGMGSIEGSRIPRGPTGEEMDSRREPEPPVADKRVRVSGERIKTARHEFLQPGGMRVIVSAGCLRSGSIPVAVAPFWRMCQDNPSPLAQVGRRCGEKLDNNDNETIGTLWTIWHPMSREEA